MFDQITVAPVSARDTLIRAAAAITCSAAMFVMAITPVSASSAEIKAANGCASVSVLADTVARIQLGKGC
jgi:hypothetical protein